MQFLDLIKEWISIGIDNIKEINWNIYIILKENYIKKEYWSNKFIFITNNIDNKLIDKDLIKKEIKNWFYNNIYCLDIAIVKDKNI